MKKCRFECSCGHCVPEAPAGSAIKCSCGKKMVAVKNIGCEPTSRIAPSERKGSRIQRSDVGNTNAADRRRKTEALNRKYRRKNSKIAKQKKYGKQTQNN